MVKEANREMAKKENSVDTEDVEKQKEQAVDATLKEIRTLFNDKGIVMKMGDHTTVDVGITSTGSLILDSALGVGGYPKGRIIEIYGPESSGKTTLALEAIAQIQKAGGTAAFIDAEHAIDPDYARTLGVDTDKLIMSQPDYGEQAFEITDMLAKSNAFDMVVIDSVAALVPRSELEGNFEDSSVGVQARMMSKALKKLVGVLSKTNCTVIFINQLREKIGVLYGNPETTTGGRALKFYTTIRMEIRKGDPIKNGDKLVGNVVNVKVVKNKVAPPYKQCKINLIYGEGISHENELATCAVEQGLFEKAGSWFSYNGQRVGQGIQSVVEFLKSNPEIAQITEQQVRQSLRGGDTV